MEYPAISSNTLFHFVNKREYLLDILKSDFRARYCLEKLDCIFPNDSRPNYWNIAIPMVCFCDLTLSNTYKHLQMYGKYGIGLTKKWGIRNGLTPILYVHDKSPLIKTVRQSVDVIAKSIENPEDQYLDHLVNEFIDTVYYTKPYIGDFERKGGTIRNVRFYDEREWRFVPKGALRLDIEHFKDEKFKAEQYKKLGKSRTLKFTPDDIRYIIVEKEEEILEMVNDIQELKGKKYTSDQVRVLQTRIISAEQIREDF